MQIQATIGTTPNNPDGPKTGIVEDGFRVRSSRTSEKITRTTRRSRGTSIERCAGGPTNQVRDQQAHDSEIHAVSDGGGSFTAYHRAVDLGRTNALSMNEGH
jgi:hypothetical protein